MRMWGVSGNDDNVDDDGEGDDDALLMVMVTWKWSWGGRSSMKMSGVISDGKEKYDNHDDEDISK